VNNPIDSIEQTAQILSGFDFHVDPEDFVIYELARMIEEDRATFEGEEFRRLIDEGIRQHIEENSAVRAELVETLRRALPQPDPGAAAITQRLIRTLEDVDADLRSAVVIVRAYTAYLFNRLESIDDTSLDEETARAGIERWRNGGLERDLLVPELQRIGRPAVGPTADLLFEAPDDATIADTAVTILSGIHSPASARVLAHSVSEPMLPEDIESKASEALRKMWPLARPFILHNLRNHSHEDLPYRWFQVLVESGEASAADLILEELRVHGENPAYREDLIALLDLLRGSRDPQAEDKILGVINASETSTLVAAMLRDFLKGP
jgi:hypothetical protein